MIKKTGEVFPALQEVQLEDLNCEPRDFRDNIVGKNAQDCLDNYRQFFGNMAQKNPSLSVPNVVITRSGKTVFGPGF